MSFIEDEFRQDGLLGIEGGDLSYAMTQLSRLVQACVELEMLNMGIAKMILKDVEKTKDHNREVFRNILFHDPSCSTLKGFVTDYRL